MYQTFVELIDSVTDRPYMAMVGNTIKSKKRSLSKLRGRKGWIRDVNTSKLVCISGFGDTLDMEMV